MLNHLSLVVADPQISADFYATIAGAPSFRVWLGHSLHLRTDEGLDLAFQRGTPQRLPGAHHGFLAPTTGAVDRLLADLRLRGVKITDDCQEAGFRSVKFLDPDGYEVEVYWEADWPAPGGAVGRPDSGAG
ncbi:MAG: VOC family protein [Pseudomonadales bacterium]